MADIKSIIKARIQNIMEVFSTKDPIAISKLYTVDSKMMPPGVDVQFGREGVAGVFQSFMQAGAARVKLDLDEAGPLGAEDMAYSRGHFTISKEDESVLESGKILAIWKEVDGVWLVYIETFNRNAPQPKP